MNIFSLLAIALTAVLTHANEPSAFDKALQVDTAIETHESDAEYFSVRYRKIETKTATFYAKAGPGGENMIDVYCGQPSFFSDNHLKQGRTVIFQRSRQFVQRLNESCLVAEKKKTMELELEPGRPNKTVKPAPGDKKKAL